jgi:hypothetical protein
MWGSHKSILTVKIIGMSKALYLYAIEALLSNIGIPT